MNVVLADSAGGEQWDAVAEGSSDAWLFHRSAWLGIEATFGAEKDLSFGIVDDRGELVAIHPLYLRNVPLGAFTERLLDCGFHRHTGLATAEALPAGQKKAARKLAMRHVFELAESLDVDRIQLNAHNLAPANLRASREEVPFWVRDWGFHLGLNFGENGCIPVPGMATCCADQIVPLGGRGEEEILAALDESCRRAVRKARKNNVDAITSDGASAVEEYLAIAELSARRTGESLPPSDYYSRIQRAFADSGRCRVLFAAHDGKKVAGVILLIDKGAASFLAGASDPAYLPMRVNDLLHCSAMLWAAGEGLHSYRLGPTFPELPPDWPICKVSRFKGKFGGRCVPIIQGSYFRKPEKYAPLGESAVRSLCSPRPTAVRRSPAPEARIGIHAPQATAEDLSVILRAYGMMGTAFTPARPGDAGVVIASDPSQLDMPGLSCWGEPGKRLYVDERGPAYHALLGHVSFAGEGIRPVWRNEDGRAVAAWLNRGGKEIFLLGLDVVEEVVRHRQGDPARADQATSGDRAKFGFEFERPNYLFEGQLHSDFPREPWADRLGFLLAEAVATLSGCPLVEPLPGGAKGMVLLTGDDDEAYLEKYRQQLRLIGRCPITYFLTPKTRHTAETIADLPANVQFGLHPDALEAPDSYDSLCGVQANEIRQLTGARIRTVRNHGFLNRGYLGHLQAWEQTGLLLDVNYPGLDGTALNGSFLPMRVRRPDGTWSDHYSLLTAFGDGMKGALGMTDRQAVGRIRQVAGAVEPRCPAALAFNFHPQNVSETARLHRAVLKLARRKGWAAMGMESYLDWLGLLEGVAVDPARNVCRVSTRRPAEGLVLKHWRGGRWRRMALGPCSSTVEVELK